MTAPSPQPEPLPPDLSSRAALRGHPVHPMLVVVPAAALAMAPVADVVHLVTATAFWAEAARWLLVVGVASGLVAAVPGLVDFLGIDRVRHHPVAIGHLAANATALSLAAISAILRLDDPVAAVSPWGLVTSGLAAAAVGAGGWLGGELTYRHGVGVHRRPSR